MKKILTCALAVVFVASSVTGVFADPTNPQKADNNPQTVAYYTSGDHGVVGESSTHTGTDYVRQDGNSGNFDQWFCGSATSPDQLSECEHSVWLSVGSQTSCMGNGKLVENASASWGSYLSSGNYCVFTNDANAH